MKCYAIPPKGADDLPLFGVAVSKNELKKISEGIPVWLDGNKFGLGVNLCFQYADSEKEIESQLIERGLVRKQESEGG